MKIPVNAVIFTWTELTDEEFFSLFSDSLTVQTRIYYLIEVVSFSNAICEHTSIYSKYNLILVLSIELW